MRTITNLIIPGKHVYIHFETKDLCRQFLQQAKWEGFTIGDSGKPTGIKPTDILAVMTEKNSAISDGQAEWLFR